MWLLQLKPDTSLLGVLLVNFSYHVKMFKHKLQSIFIKDLFFYFACTGKYLYTCTCCNSVKLLWSLYGLDLCTNNRYFIAILLLLYTHRTLDHYIFFALARFVLLWSIFTIMDVVVHLSFTFCIDRLVIWIM